MVLHYTHCDHETVVMLQYRLVTAYCYDLLCTLKAHTPEQWVGLVGATTRSPPCMGGGVTHNTST